MVCTSDQAELVADRLLQCGASAVAEEAVAPESIGPEPATSSVAIEAAVGVTGDVVTAHVEGFTNWLGTVFPAAAIEFPVIDAAWADAWREHAEAVTAGPFLVRPPWVEVASVRSGALRPDPIGRSPVELVVDPGRAFGSGSHPTTRMCLEALGDLMAPHGGDVPHDGNVQPGGDGRTALARLRPGCTVADVGCGSGILAVGALLLGAQEAVGVDIDPTARTASRAVASANGVGERYEFRDGGIAPLCHRGQCFDVVVANVLIPVIEEHGRDLQAMCRPGGAIVVSGLLVDQRDRALAALEPSEVMREYSSDGWVTLVMTNRTGGRR